MSFVRRNGRSDHLSTDLRFEGQKMQFSFSSSKQDLCKNFFKVKIVHADATLLI